MNAVTNEALLQQWTAIQEKLSSSGISFKKVTIGRKISGPTDKMPWGSATLECDSAPSTTADIESIFRESGMAVIDLIPEDDYSLSRLRVWFHPSERVSNLELQSATLESLANRLAAVVTNIRDRPFLSDSPTEPPTRKYDTSWTMYIAFTQITRETAFGPHGRLAILMSGVKERDIVLNLGPLGWISGNFTRKQLSAQKAEAADLHVADAIYEKIREFMIIGRGGFLTGGTALVIATTIISTGLVMPFMQAFAAQAAQDCYGLLKNLLRRHPHANRLLDPNTRTELIFDTPLPDEAILQLANMKPKRLEGRVVRWDQKAAKWRIVSRDRGSGATPRRDRMLRRLMRVHLRRRG